MSKLAKAIKITQLNQYRPVSELNTNYLSTEFLTESLSIEELIRLQVTLKTDKWLNKSLTNQADIDLRYEIIKDIKRAMIEEIFGEFRPYLIELRSSLYDKDLSRARTLLAQMEEQMFVEGL